MFTQLLNLFNNLTDHSNIYAYINEKKKDVEMKPS